MLPLPLAPIPIFVLLLVQAKVAPTGDDVKFSADTADPLHTVCEPADGLTVGNGFIVMLNVPGVPTQPAKVGVTEIVPTCWLATTGAV